MFSMRELAADRIKDLLVRPRGLSRHGADRLCKSTTLASMIN